MSRLRPLGVFAAAFVVRIVYLAQIRDSITFDVPLVDGINYFRTASAIASGDLLAGSGAFWQPPLYPYFLASLLALFGRNFVLIYAVQAALGSVSCVLVYRIGARLFGERAGLAAAGIVILYGPLIYFDVQPLIPTLHIVLMLAGLLFLLRAAGIPGPAAEPPREWALAGLAWGLSSIATPNLLLALPVAAWWARRRAGATRAGIGLLLAGASLPVGIVAARNLAVAGEPVLISSNGGINLFLGNNPDYDTTVRIRPGGGFERLAQEPENQGILSPAAKSRYFSRRAFDFLRRHPLQAARLYGHKLRELAAGREIPRNQDPYAYRERSSLLRGLLWRAGIAFPFGLVAPLALAGVVPPPRDRSRAGWLLLLLLAAAYAISILIFFPTSRYRLPLIPIAAILAGRFLAGGPAVWRRPIALALLGAGLVVFNLDAMTPSDSWPEEEALDRAYALETKGRLQDAWGEYARAARLAPDRIDAHNAMAVLAASVGRWDEAARRYEKVLSIAPDFVEVRRSLGLAYDRLGRVEEARRQWRIAIEQVPAAGLALADLCLSYIRDRAIDVAAPYCEDAVLARPDLGETHFARGILAREQGDAVRADRELQEAIRRLPDGHPAARQAAGLLARPPA